MKITWTFGRSRRWVESAAVGIAAFVLLITVVPIMLRLLLGLYFLAAAVLLVAGVTGFLTRSC